MGWPVAWLQEMMSAEEFDGWCKFHLIYPLDDQSNFHMPLASFHANFLNANRAPNSPPHSMKECMLFARDKQPSLEEQVLSGDW